MEFSTLEGIEASAMWIDYPQAISQSAAELLTLERQQRGSAVADRVKMLRLLKTNVYPSQRQVAAVLGYTERQVRRWWSVYSEGGLSALLKRDRPGGRVERLDAAALAALEAEMRAGRIGRLGDAQRFLADRCGVSYHSVSGLSRLCQRHKITLKTGRRHHRRADPDAQAAFKKTSPNT
jgi:transposase